MPSRPLSIHRRPAPNPPRHWRALPVAALLGAAVGLSGYSTFGALAGSGGEAAISPAPPPKQSRSLASLRRALARLAISTELAVRETGEQPPVDAKVESGRVASEEDEPEMPSVEPEARDVAGGAFELSGQSAEPHVRGSTHRGRLPGWRYSPYYYHRPYWHDHSYYSSSDWEDDAEIEGWWFPADSPPPEESPSHPDADRCPRDPQRWLVRLQGPPMAGESAAGLVCLVDIDSSSVSGARLSLLNGLVRVLARSAPARESAALLFNGNALGVVVPPAPDSDPAELAANLSVLGLADADARAAALVRAFAAESRDPSSRPRMVIIDRSLSLAIVTRNELAMLVAAERDGDSLRRHLGVEANAPDTGDPALQVAPVVPALPANAALRIEVDGCPPARDAPPDAEPVSSALCVGDGGLLGGRGGNSATMIYEIEAAGTGPAPAPAPPA